MTQEDCFIQNLQKYQGQVKKKNILKRNYCKEFKSLLRMFRKLLSHTLKLERLAVTKSRNQNLVQNKSENSNFVFNAMTAQPFTDLEGDLSRSFLTLEKIDVNIFRAHAASLIHPVGSRFVFGGQVVGQALVAACNTVEEYQHAHSLHCYFLRGGSNKKAVLYHVDRTRDGKTYTSRSVKATQDGIPIFTMQASFKSEEEDPLQHQFTMPQVPGPEGLESSNDFLQRQLDENPDMMSDKERKMIINMLKQKFHVDKRPVDPELYHLRRQGEPKRYVWVRAQGNIGENLKLQQCVAGFISDIALLGAAMQPAPTGHKVGFITSLDHSMWFHNPFRADEWMLYEIESPQCGKGKALSLGRMWRRDGVLAVSMAQEGVVRSHKSML